MDYLKRVEKINNLARSLMDNGLASSSDQAMRIAEEMVDKGAETMRQLSEKKAQGALEDPEIKQ